MPRPPFLAIVGPLLFCCISLAVLPAKRAQAPAQRLAISVDTASLPRTTLPCLARASDADPLTSFLWRFEEARAQALATGRPGCLADVATGAELSNLLGTLNAVHVAAQPLRITLRALAVDTVRPEADGSLTVTAQVSEVRTPLSSRGQADGVPFRDDRTVLYRLRPTAPAHQPPGWLVEDDAIPSLPPLPPSLSGPHLADLDSVVNRSTALSLADSATGSNLLRLIAANGFAVHPQSLVPDFFTDSGAQGDGPSSGIYARNGAEAIPSLITLDAALHVYHVLQSRLTVAAEMSVLPRRLQTLLGDLLTATATQRARLSDGPASDALQRNAIYLAVADLLAGGAWPADALTADEAALAAREVNLIRTHPGSARSPVLGRAIDYGAFAPQGHYALSAGLTGYAQALRWLRVAAPALGVSRVTALQAVLLALALRAGGPRGALMDEWHGLADPLIAFAGPAEPPSVPEFDGLVTAIYGTGSALSSASDPARLARLMARVGASGWQGYALIPTAAQPDLPLIGGPAPSGLDVLAAFGSSVARKLRPKSPGAGSLAPLPAPTSVPHDSSLYSGGLAVLHALAVPGAAGTPSFMLDASWGRATLASALGWWSELHQDPQPLAGLLDRRIVTADPTTLAPARPAYVEPEPAAWYALAQLAERLAGLTVDAHLLDGLPAGDALAFEAATRAYAGTVLRLGHIADDELCGSPVAPSDTPALQDPDRTLGADALVAERHLPGVLHLAGSQSAALADPAGVLAAAEGPPQELWALVPIGGALYLARGVVYSYYEFAMPPHPISDAAWQGGAWMQRRQPGWTQRYER